MKRGIVQALAFTTVLSSTILGIAPTQAQAYVRVGRDGTKTEVNVETGDKKTLSENEYNKIQDTWNSQSTISKQGVLQDGWNIPDNLTDISQIKYVKDGKPLSGGHQTVGGHEVWLEADGSLGTGWKQDSQGNWRYFMTNGVMLMSGYVDNYDVKGGIWDKSSNEAYKNKDFKLEIILYSDSSTTKSTSLTESQFRDYLKQGKIGTKISYFGAFGETDISKLTQTFSFYLK